ncbi:hypothetical protein V8E54_006139 [Elaphomyces granulatus]
MGWIQRDLTPEVHTTYCTFPTALHAAYMEYRYSLSYKELFPIQYSKVRDLYMTVAPRFSARLLRDARDNMRFGPGGVQRAKESAYQDDFYRAYTDLFNFSGNIVSEWMGNIYRRNGNVLCVPLNC